MDKLKLLRNINWNVTTDPVQARFDFNAENVTATNADEFYRNTVVHDQRNISVMLPLGTSTFALVSWHRINVCAQGERLVVNDVLKAVHNFYQQKVTAKDVDHLLNLTKLDNDRIRQKNNCDLNAQNCKNVHYDYQQKLLNIKGQLASYAKPDPKKSALLHNLYYFNGIFADKSNGLYVELSPFNGNPNGANVGSRSPRSSIGRFLNYTSGPTPTREFSTQTEQDDLT